MMRFVPDVSVVVCAYSDDRLDYLVSAVRSARRQSLPPKEVIVVVDHNERLLIRARERLRGVEVIENTEAPGASGARNCGVAAAAGAVVAFLDDDAEAESDWLAQLVPGYRDPRVLGVGGMLVPEWAGRPPRWFPDELNWVVGCTYRGMPGATAPVRNLIAANMSVRRDVFLEVGGFRGGFGNTRAVAGAGPRLLTHRAGDEETELCIRAQRRWPAGLWLYEPRARVRHKVPPGRSRWSYLVWRCYDEGLGKASLVRALGARDGLADERAYAFRVLPRGVVRNLSAALFGRQASGLARAGAIVVGLAATAAGYAVGSLWSRVGGQSGSSPTP